jgi:hypothetical protein
MTSRLGQCMRDPVGTAKKARPLVCELDVDATEIGVTHAALAE